MRYKKHDKLLSWLWFLTIALFIISWFLPNEWFPPTIVSSVILYIFVYNFQNYEDKRFTDSIAEAYRNYVPPPWPSLGISASQLDQSDNGYWSSQYTSRTEITAEGTIHYRFYTFRNGSLLFTNGYLTKITIN